MDYRHFSAVDFAADSSFIDWVRHPNATSTAFWEDFLNQHPNQAKAVTTAKELVMGWHINAPVPPKGSQEEVWLKIQADLTNVAPDRPAIRLPWGDGQGAWYLRYAAVFVGFLVIAGLYGWLSTNWQTTHYAAGNGETKTITLPDGSAVTLAANSSIDLIGDWEPEHPRELALKGDAFFSVTHQTNNQTFVVKTPDNLRIEVLGTTFTVTERAANTQVVLNTGRVALYRNQDTRPLLMKPGELVEVPKAQQQRMVRRSVQPEVYSAWKDNQFIFENTSLSEIAAIIESEFNYKILFARDSLKNLRVTLRLPNRDLTLLLTSLSEIHDLKIDRKTNQILINQHAPVLN